MVKITPKVESLNEVVYADSHMRVTRVWRSNLTDIELDPWTNSMIAHFTDAEGRKRAAVVTLDGKLTVLPYEHVFPFTGDVAYVFRKGKYGFIDRSLKLVIPLKYDSVNDDHFDGYFTATIGKNTYFVDIHGVETRYPFRYEPDDSHSMQNERIAFRSGSGGTQIWGFRDLSGNEVIPPQFSHVNDFHCGVAFAARHDPSGNEKWGSIDKNGNIVIPFIFDEISQFYLSTVYGPIPRSDIFAVRMGAKWGVIDEHGNWVEPPRFGSVGSEYTQGYIAVSYDEDSAPVKYYGIYDVGQRKVVYEPDMERYSVAGDGEFCAETYDKRIGRATQKIISFKDGTMTEIRRSANTPKKFRLLRTTDVSLHACGDFYIAKTREGDYGLMSKAGEFVVPCEFDGVCLIDMTENARNCLVRIYGACVLFDFESGGLTPIRCGDDLCTDVLEVDSDLRLFITEQIIFRGVASFDGDCVIPMRWEKVESIGSNDYVCCDADCSEYYTVSKL